MNLTRKNIIKCGFFPDNLPTRVFTSNYISDHLEADIRRLSQIDTNLTSRKIESTPCHLISSYKSDMERRIIAIPHIETYALLADEIEKNRAAIESNFRANPNSYSNVIKPNSIAGYPVRSNFFKNYLDRTIFSTGFKYLLKIDLSKCYENIYTHSISWALYGKDMCKMELKKPPSSRDIEYLKADNLDKITRKINNNETKGIPTGPLSSRIVSEIILTSIDEILRNMGVHFKRYVDDYNFFFRSELDAYEFLPKFQNILYEYKLHVNTEKTKLEKYPYQLNQDFTKELRGYNFAKNGYLKYVERLIELHNDGYKGALKYGLKVLNSSSIPSKEKELVFSHLINIVLTFPNLSECVYSIFLNNTFSFNSKTEETVNDVLSNCIKNQYDLETLWLLTIMCSLKMIIGEENVIAVIKQMEPCSTIIALDYIKHFRLLGNPAINAAVRDLKTKLQSENAYGDKWLLLYEANRNNWITGIRSQLNVSKFLNEACLANIAFFSSPIS